MFNIFWSLFKFLKSFIKPPFELDTKFLDSPTNIISVNKSLNTILGSFLNI